VKKGGDEHTPIMGQIPGKPSWDG